ncbi:helix-turn-helix transcriptional regulator [Rhodococcus artemisiae]|uniref:Helix-turn-helix domain-containing protein n=1 Tax=Rhodococcus artemisiae TaxID=714159 RepID=A0ABU7L353_9NOCA|nr:helix-turn-helix domain-containing protein [Rhodococcus artemisiae]MEE2055963.1 helix-turn-helix domain-containing protein [Rhodococcus artemisiae]
MPRNRTKRRIGNIVRELRSTRGLSRHQLAILTGTHAQTIGSLEREQQQPSLDVAMRISAAFDRQVQEVFFWIETPGPHENP